MNKLLILAMGLMMTAQTVAANEQSCAVVSTNIMSLDTDQYRVILTNAGEKAKRLRGHVAIKPGRHRFTVVAVERESGATLDPNTYLHKSYEQLSRELVIELEVKADRVYRLVAQTTHPANSPSKRGYKVVVAHESAKPCVSEHILSRTTDKLLVATTKLPEHLQYRLSMVAKDIHRYYKAQGISTPSVILSQQTQVIDLLGLVIDYQAPAKQGLKILAVTPSSAAANIGLKPGDIITQINDLKIAKSQHEAMTHKAMVEALKVMIAHLSADNPGQLKVNRGGKRETLPTLFEDVSLPGYTLELLL